MHNSQFFYNFARYDEKIGYPPIHSPASGSYRVKRGGSFADTSDFCSVSYIGYSNPYDRDPSLGFRVVRTITE